MGRGNICVTGEYEGLYYLDTDLLDMYSKVDRCGECGHVTGFDPNESPKTARELSDEGIPYGYDGDVDWQYDRDLSDENWNDMIAHMRDCLSKRFPSFNETDKRIGDKHVVLANAQFMIAVADNEWSVAWCLLERKDGEYEYAGRPNLRDSRRYLNGIKDALIDGWGEAIGYGGAWTHGEVYRKKGKSA